MSRWRAKALELLPEFATRIQGFETPYLLWIELGWEFQRAYDAPLNEDLIRRFYMYADWCWKQRRHKELDLRNCVAVCFYEHLPDHRAVREDIPRWLSSDRFRDLGGLLEWRLGREEFAKLKADYEANCGLHEANFERSLRRPRPSASKAGEGKRPKKA